MGIRKNQNTDVAIICQNWPETYEYSMNFHPSSGIIVIYVQ